MGLFAKLPSPHLKTNNKKKTKKKQRLDPTVPYLTMYIYDGQLLLVIALVIAKC